jgi:hypothetical protein
LKLKRVIFIRLFQLLVFFDTHKDVHFDGCFKKTVKEQQGKVQYCLDHKLEWHSVIAWKEDVKMFTANIPWGMVGKDFSGETEGLIFEIQKEKIRLKDVLTEIENKTTAFENSIRMIYMSIKLGMNSNVKDHEEEKKYYDKRINEIANKDDVEKDGYFWGVEDLAIFREGSLVAATGGSNSATSIYQKNIEPTLEDTQKQEQEAAERTLESDRNKNYLSIKSKLLLK